MDKVLIVYYSGTGNTEQMANLIADGVKEAGKEVELFNSSSFDQSTIDEYAAIALGCPAMGEEVLEEDEFEPLYNDIKSKLNGKKVALFGSYGWGDGEWMRNWQADLELSGATLIEEGLIVCGAPENDDERACIELGKTLAQA